MLEKTEHNNKFSNIYIDEKLLPFYPKELKIKELECINKMIKKEKEI
jgi:hypothetical protein